MLKDRANTFAGGLMILASWFVKQGKNKFDLLGGCGIEKPPYQAAAY